MYIGPKRNKVMLGEPSRARQVPPGGTSPTDRFRKRPGLLNVCGKYGF